MPVDTHPLLLEGPVAPGEPAGLRRRQTVGLVFGADELAEGRMRGEVDAPREALNAVRGYAWYMHVTDHHPDVVLDDGVSEDDVLAAVVGHVPGTGHDQDAWSSYIDPVPALVDEIRRLLKVLEIRCQDQSHARDRRSPRL